MIRINVNGRNHDLDVASDTPLLWVLRDHLKLTGAKFGCGIAQCGACRIHLDGNAIPSCVLSVSSAGNGKIITIEGIGKGEELHPVQKAWIHENVPQCGYCQPGQIMTVIALLNKNPNPTNEEIETALTGNICRCGTYDRIKRAIQKVVKSGSLSE